jgi:hypothetical protein
MRRWHAHAWCASYPGEHHVLWATCTLDTQKPPPMASRRAKKSENTQKRYETGRRYLKQKGPRSLCGPPKPPDGHIWPRQRLAHLRVDVEGRHERPYRPRPRTWDRTTAVLTSNILKYPKIRRSIKQGPRTHRFPSPRYTQLYELYLKRPRTFSLCGPPTPPHGHIWPRQRLVHLRVDVEGRHEQLYHPRPRTWDRTTAVLTSDL